MVLFVVPHVLPAAALHVTLNALAGATSALLSCPAELVMIQQQRTGHALREELREIGGRYGYSKLYRGLVSHRSGVSFQPSCLCIFVVEAV